MTPVLQDLIHKLEVGSGTRYLRMGLVLLALVVLTGGYNRQAFRNMSTQEAMDSAQLARNISRGKGYTTLFVRPFSIFLIKNRYEKKNGRPAADQIVDEAQVKVMHPDVANPPVYPLILAGLMKVLPFHYALPYDKTFWSENGKSGRSFYRYQPDFLIALFNQALIFVLVVMVFFLARQLFDPTVAWLSSAVLLGTELVWRFSVSWTDPKH